MDGPPPGSYKYIRMILIFVILQMSNHRNDFFAFEQIPYRIDDFHNPTQDWLKQFRDLITQLSPLFFGKKKVILHP